MPLSLFSLESYLISWTLKPTLINSSLCILSCFFYFFIYIYTLTQLSPYQQPNPTSHFWENSTGFYAAGLKVRLSKNRRGLIDVSRAVCSALIKIARAAADTARACPWRQGRHNTELTGCVASGAQHMLRCSLVICTLRQGGGLNWLL